MKTYNLLQRVLSKGFNSKKEKTLFIKQLQTLRHKLSNTQYTELMSKASNKRVRKRFLRKSGF